MSRPSEKDGAPPGALSDAALDQLFRNARSFSYWLDKPVGDDTLRQLYEWMKWGPTSANGSPARILFLRTLKAMQRLLPALSPANVGKVRDAFAQSPELAEVTARRNSSLQGAHLTLRPARWASTVVPCAIFGTETAPGSMPAIRG